MVWNLPFTRRSDSLPSQSSLAKAGCAAMAASTAAPIMVRILIFSSSS
jgi:hypothetical protein